MYGTSKTVIRRIHDSRFATTYFRGDGIDIGAGKDPLSKYYQQFPLMTSLNAYDWEDGDSQFMEGVPDNHFDFVHSSHCLEHVNDPLEAFTNWIRICKPGGHLIIMVPDEDLYEQGVWPSNFNPDHKYSFTILKKESWCPASLNVLDFLYQFRDKIEVLKIELINGAHIYDEYRWDQTFHSISESNIEIIVRKRTQTEIDRKGRLPTLI